MNIYKFLGAILCPVFCLMFVMANVACAAVKTIETSGVYIMDTQRDETFSVAEDRARREARRMAVEESGMFLQSSSQVINDRLSKDELRVLAAAVLKIENENVAKKKLDGENIEFTVTIKAVVDTDKVNLNKLVDKKKEWATQVEKNQQQKAEYEALKTENERLKAEYAKATDENERKKIKAASLKNNKMFEANQYLDKSLAMLSSGEWLSSLDESKKALDTDPTNADVLASRARAHVKANNLETAKDEIMQALRLNPQNNDYKVIMGNVYFAAGEYDNAMDYYNQVLTEDKDNAEVYYQIGMIYFKRDSDYDKAIEEFYKATIKDSNYAEAYFMLGRSYFNKNAANPALSNRNEPPTVLIGAFENFSKYLTFDNVPRKAEASQLRTGSGNLLVAYYRLNDDLANADKYLTSMNNGGNEKDKSSAQKHIEKGTLYLQGGSANELKEERMARYDKAIAEFTKAIELEPNNANAYGKRGEAYLDKGWANAEFFPDEKETPFFDLAIKDLEKCLKLNPNHVDAKRNIARINRAVDDKIKMTKIETAN